MPVAPVKKTGSNTLPVSSLIEGFEWDLTSNGALLILARTAAPADVGGSRLLA